MIGGPPPAAYKRRRGRPQIWRITIFVLAAIFFLVPLAAAFKYSLQQDTGGYGFANYGEIVSNKDVRAPLVTSLEIAAISAAVVILLMWCYVGAYIVLAGAELNSEYEKARRVSKSEISSK